MNTGERSSRAAGSSGRVEDRRYCALTVLDEDLDEIVALLDAYCPTLDSRADTSWY